MNNKRKQIDKKNLLLAGYIIEDSDKPDNPFDFIITNFKGPKESVYEGGQWKIHVQLPENYPYKSPSVGFVNKIFHPNVDEKSGTICLDVLNQKWSPLFELKNVFEVFLPQLLLYPNPSDPLNHEAANLLLHHKNDYKEKVKKYIKSFAGNEEEEEKEVIKEKDSKEKVIGYGRKDSSGSGQGEEKMMLNRKSSRFSQDNDEYEKFFGDEEDLELEIEEEDNKNKDEDDDKSIISNNSVNEEISFGKIHNEGKNEIDMEN